MDDPTGLQGSPSLASQIMAGIPEGLERAQVQQMFIQHPLEVIGPGARVTTTIPSAGNLLMHNPQLQFVLRMKFDVPARKLQPSVNFTIEDPRTTDPTTFPWYAAYQVNSAAAANRVGWYMDGAAVNEVPRAQTAWVAPDQWVSDAAGQDPEVPAWNIESCAPYYDFDGDPMAGYFPIFKLWKLITMPNSTTICEVNQYYAHVIRQLSHMDREQLAQWQLAVGAWQAFDDQMLDPSSSLPIQQNNVKCIATRATLNSDRYEDATELIIEREVRLPFPFELKNWPMIAFNEGLQLFTDFYPNYEQHFQQVPKHWGCFPVIGPNDIVPPMVGEDGFPDIAAATRRRAKHLELTRHTLRMTLKLNPYQLYEGKLVGTFQEIVYNDYNNDYVDTFSVGAAAGPILVIIRPQGNATALPPDNAIIEFRPNGVPLIPPLQFYTPYTVANSGGDTFTLVRGGLPVGFTGFVPNVGDYQLVTFRILVATGAVNPINYMSLGYMPYSLPKLAQRVDTTTDIVCLGSMSRFPRLAAHQEPALAVAENVIGVDYLACEFISVQLRTRDLAFFTGLPILGPSGQVATYRATVNAADVRRPMQLSPLRFQGFMMYVWLGGVPPQKPRTELQAADFPRAPLQGNVSVQNVITTAVPHCLSINQVVSIYLSGGEGLPVGLAEQAYTVATAPTDTTFSLQTLANPPVAVMFAATANVVVTIVPAPVGDDATYVRRDIPLGSNALTSSPTAVWVSPDSIDRILLGPRNLVVDLVAPDLSALVGGTVNQTFSMRSIDDEFVGDMGTVTVVFKRSHRPRVLLPRPAGRSFDGYNLSVERTQPRIPWIDQFDPTAVDVPLQAVRSQDSVAAAANFVPPFIDVGNVNAAGDAVSDPFTWDRTGLGNGSACVYSLGVHIVTDFTNELTGVTIDAGNRVLATYTNVKPKEVAMVNTKFYYESVEMDPAYTAMIAEKLMSPEGFDLTYVDAEYHYRNIMNQEGEIPVDFTLNKDTTAGGLFFVQSLQKIGKNGYYPLSTALPFEYTRLLIQNAEQLLLMPEDWAETYGSLRPVKLPLFQRNHTWNTSHWNMPLFLKGKTERKRIDSNFAALMGNIKGASQLSMETTGNPIQMNVLLRNNQWVFPWSGAESVINRGVSTGTRFHIWRLEYRMHLEMWNRTWVSQHSTTVRRAAVAAIADSQAASRANNGNRFDATIWNFSMNDMPTRLSLLKQTDDQTAQLVLVHFYVRKIVIHAQGLGSGIGGGMTYTIIE